MPAVVAIPFAQLSENKVALPVEASVTLPPLHIVPALCENVGVVAAAFTVSSVVVVQPTSVW